MAKPKQTNKKNAPLPAPITPKEDNSRPVRLNKFLLWAKLGLVFCLFCFSVFKNIQYPLFWADESMTVIGAQRVLEFGYPKVHDGKNVFYDLKHSNPTLGIDEKTDAYVGGTSWGHYYFGTLGVKLAENTSDLYTKTGIIRSTFAIMGVLGMVLFVWLTAGFFQKKEHQLLYAILFFFFSLFSVSLALLLREARYYALSIFLFSLISGIYLRHRFIKPMNPHLVRFGLAVLMWCLFMTFAPVFFILGATLMLSECILVLRLFLQKNKLRQVLTFVDPVLSGLVLASAGVLPLLGFFKTFEISEALSAFYKLSARGKEEHATFALAYFKEFEFFWLAVALKVTLLLNFRKVVQNDVRLLKASLYALASFAIYIYLITNIPSFIYTRYIIVIQPILTFSIVFDALVILLANTRKDLILGPKTAMLSLVLLAATGMYVSQHTYDLKGHVYELTHPYKGPLDYTIPYIQEKYKATDTLIIAANYEETSYMYYLGSKVTVGYVGNNLAEDSLLVPDVIAYRRNWGNFVKVFNKFWREASYSTQTFPVFDNPLNNIPELNFFKPAFNHQFRTLDDKPEKENVVLYLKK